jgi:hypothetical protein
VSRRRVEPLEDESDAQEDELYDEPRSSGSAAFFVAAALVLFGLAAWWVINQPPPPPVEAPVAGRLLPPTLTPGLFGSGGSNTPRPQTQLGIVAGHNWLKTLPDGDVIRDLEAPYDSGARCDDYSAIEADITLDIAKRVAAELRQTDKLEVELLGEFDPRLRGYFGVALISLHADACLKSFSGYKVARLIESQLPAVEDRLVNCLRERYQAVTGLSEHRNTITVDMQEYHAFREIALTTPGAILEMGFLREDQALLRQGDLPVKGIVEGIRCFLGRR